MITPISQVMVQKSFRFLLQNQTAITREVTRSQEDLPVRGRLWLGPGKMVPRRMYGCDIAALLWMLTEERTRGTAGTKSS